MRVHLVASGGGHLDVLRRGLAGSALSGLEPVWCTTPGRGADALRAAGQEVRVLPPVDRRNLRPQTLWRSLDLVRRERPELVVTSGAGVAVAFCAGARARGARLLFVETMARVGDVSRSGRVLSRLAERAVVQWPEDVVLHQPVTLCRPALLEDVATVPAPPGTGTYVSLGTHHQPFGRLLDLVDRAAAAGVLPAPVLVQAGASAPRRSTAGVAVRDWLGAEEVGAAIAGSSVIVAQAAAGVAAAALRVGRRPILVARLGSRGEHVDDHQLQLAAKLAELGLAVVPRGELTPADVEAAQQPVVAPEWPSHLGTVSQAIDAFLARG